MYARVLMLCALVSAIAAVAMAGPAVAVAPGTGAFQRTWARTDKPVADLHVSRTWMWAPEASSPLLYEEYDEAPGGKRAVQYFDKSRMEDNSARGTAPWDVTNGLLVSELVTGQLQVGDGRYETLAPAQVNVAGDQDDPNGPTYASYSGLLDVTVDFQLETITQVINRDGTISLNPDLASYAIGTATFVSETQHWIAEPFWEFMNATGLVYEDGAETTAPLFLNPYYATGFPIVEPAWANVRVAGVSRWVLIQCFQRRCLTYTPDNAEGWKVEVGNVGQHYYAWRYADQEPEPVPIPTTGDLRIGTIFWDSPVSGEQSGEWLTIVNDDEHAVQLQGWRLEDDGADNVYVFPAFVLAPGATVTVHTCTGTNSSSDLYTGKCSPWWNNNGDTAYLYDATGALVDSYSY